MLVSDHLDSSNLAEIWAELDLKLDKTQREHVEGRLQQRLKENQTLMKHDYLLFIQHQV